LPHRSLTAPFYKTAVSGLVLEVKSGTVRSRDGFVMYNGRLGMEMLELFIPVKALDDWMLATG
jgi:hypothetical protein